VTDGKNADYIPYLAGVSSQLFGIAMIMPDRKMVEAGDTSYGFGIESIAKVFTLALIMNEFGSNIVRQKLGVSATGMPFNSVMALELRKRNPLSPPANAGAIATVSLVQAESSDVRWKKISANLDAFGNAQLPLHVGVSRAVQPLVRLLRLQ
jgi:glutaminase